MPTAPRVSIRPSHRSLGHFALVRREGRQDFTLLTRRDPEVIEGPSQLGRNLIELIGGDVEFAMCLFQPEGGAPGFVALNENGPPATSQTHSVRMNFSPGSLSRWLVCHSRRSGFFDPWPTIGFLTTASLKWSTTAAMANTPPNRSYRARLCHIESPPQGSRKTASSSVRRHERSPCMRVVHLQADELASILPRSRTTRPPRILDTSF